MINYHTSCEIIPELFAGPTNLRAESPVMVYANRDSAADGAVGDNMLSDILRRELREGVRIDTVLIVLWLSPGRAIFLLFQRKRWLSEGASIMFPAGSYYGHNSL